MVTPCILQYVEKMVEYGDDEDLPGAWLAVDVGVARDAEYEMAATRLKEPVASSDHEDGNQNTRQA